LIHLYGSFANCYRSGKVITIEAGQHGQTFTAHLPLLRHFSPFFDCNDAHEKSDEIITMREVKPEVLETVVNWMYTGRLVLSRPRSDSVLDAKASSTAVDNEPSSSKDSTSEKSSLNPAGNLNEQEEGSTDMVEPSVEVAPTVSAYEDPARHYHDLLDLYIFGTTYEMRLLRLEVTKQWQDIDMHLHRVCGSQLVKRAYKYLPERSPLLKLITSTYVARWMYTTVDAYKPKLGEVLKDYPPNFCIDLMHEMVNYPVDRKGCRISYRAIPCNFHEHLDDKETKACEVARFAREEEQLAPKRKRDSEDVIPRLKKRIADHKELWDQFIFSGKKNFAKLQLDKDNLVIGFPT
jgi:hypothetical protein